MFELYYSPDPHTVILNAAKAVAEQYNLNVRLERKYNTVWITSPRDRRAKVRIVPQGDFAEIVAILPATFVVKQKDKGTLRATAALRENDIVKKLQAVLRSYANVWRSQPLHIVH